MSRASGQSVIQPASNGHETPEFIRIHGARVHNLQNVSLDIPREQLVVITGPSGSGKSSLAFDTLYAEGQRQFIESLSVYARQFLHQMERPDVDLIEGLQPTISIDQRAGSTNPRSTVATVTDIYDHLRLLYARLGEPACYQCGAPIRQQTPEQILERLMAFPSGTKAIILAPMVRGRRGQHQETFAAIRKAQLLRARVDGEVVDIEQVPALEPRKLHTIEAVVDRVMIREGIQDRLAEAINVAVNHGDGAVLVSYAEPAENGGGNVWRDEVFSTRYACPNCNISYEELEPRTFSFNSPYGACPTCDGLGARVSFDPELILPDENLSPAAGAIAPWREATSKLQRQHKQELRDFLEAAGVEWTTAVKDWKPTLRRQALEGDGKKFPGLLIMLEQEFTTATRPSDLEGLASFRGAVVCPDCGGARLRPEARSVRLGTNAIHELTGLTVSHAREFLKNLKFGRQSKPIAQPILSEIFHRLEFLEKVGLEYLTLDRPADTLSGGELQRVRLATGLGSGLVGVCYILDEPSIGLHQRDNQRLIDALRELQQQGNTVLVVEHDEAMMRQADQLIDLGPGAGRNGGRLVAQGTPADIVAHPESVTGRYLASELKIGSPTEHRRVSKTRSITIEGVTTNNLKNVDLRIPLSALVCVTGVSGSGKSSLLNETLVPALVRKLTGHGRKPGPHASLRGTSQIDKVVQIDQAPIGRSPRSNPATYTGVFDEVRKVFAGTREARQRGYKAGRFSFNTKGGRCEECQGHGVRRIEMNFLPDIYVPCPECHGRRFNQQTLEVKYRDKSIADVLDMRVEEALIFFENFPLIHRSLASLAEVGLGYMSLGQPATTISGGEAQRIKLAAELARIDTGKTFYVLDEPTTGLHFDEINKLLLVLGRLVDLGNTVVVIEHHLDVIKSADWIIDLGPGGGEAGGRIVATGTPEEVAAVRESATGEFLKALLNGHRESGKRKTENEA